MTSSRQSGLAPAGPGGPPARARTTDGRPDHRLGLTAVLLAVGATVVSIPASASVGATVGPMEGAHGTVLADTPAWYSGAVSVLLALQGIAALAGLAGLVLGIVAATRRQVGAGVTAIVIATLAPLVSFGVFLAMVLGSVCCVA